MSFKNIFTEERDISIIKDACTLSKEILTQILTQVQIDNTPQEIDSFTTSLCSKKGVQPAFLAEKGRYSDFPASLCVMINQEAVHGIPDSVVPFKSGDIVHIDFGIIYKHFYTDHGRSIVLGEDTQKKKLAETVKLSVQHATKEAVAGKKTGDISARLEGIPQLAGYNPVYRFCGHGVGKELHTEPKISFYGKPNTGVTLQKGMLLAIENWITSGNPSLELQSDGWTYKTQDNAPTAFYEEMVLVTDEEPLLLTR